MKFCFIIQSDTHLSASSASKYNAVLLGLVMCLVSGPYIVTCNSSNERISLLICVSHIPDTKLDEWSKNLEYLRGT